MTDDPLLNLFSFSPQELAAPFDLSIKPPVAGGVAVAIPFAAPWLLPVLGASAAAVGLYLFGDELVAAGKPLIDTVVNAMVAIGEWIWEQISGSIRWLHGIIDTIIVPGIFDWLFDHTWGIVAHIAAVTANVDSWFNSFVVTLQDWLFSEIAGIVSHIAGVTTAVLGAFDVGWSLLYDWLFDKVWGIVSHVAGVTTAVLTAFDVGWSLLYEWLFNEVWGLVSHIAAVPTGILTYLDVAFSGVYGWLFDDVWGLVSHIATVPAAVASLFSFPTGPLGPWFDDLKAWMDPNVVAPILGGIQAIGEALADAFAFVFAAFMEPFVDFFRRKLTIPGRAARGEFPTFTSFIDAVFDPPDEILKGFQLFGTALIVAIPSLLMGFIPAFAPVNALWAQDINRHMRPALPFLPNAEDMTRRGLISPADFRLILEKQGFPDSLIAGHVGLLEALPTPADLVRFGVKEVYTPEVTARFGQFQDFPPRFAVEMRKLGFSEETSLNYWAAHWDLPSPGQGFEMLHRGIIDFPTLELLLRALDVMPFWRDKLTAIAYNVVTRVDVRRLHAAGVIDRAKVKRTYLDIGYKEEDAEALTEWTVRAYPVKGPDTPDDLRSLTTAAIKQAYARRLISRDEALDRLMELDYAEDDAELFLSLWDLDFLANPSLRGDVDPKGLARTTIERAYERRLVDFNAAVAELTEMGFTPEDASLLLQLVDLRLNEQLADLQIDIALNDYQAGVITDAELAARLGDLNIPPARIDFLLEREILRRQAKTARLTLAQLQRALRAAVIDASEFVTRLDAMGYNARDSDLILAIT